eukprot:10896892-Alexandrium_andersonii.AAC.1
MKSCPFGRCDSLRVTRQRVPCEWVDRSQRLSCTFWAAVLAIACRDWAVVAICDCSTLSCAWTQKGRAPKMALRLRSVAAICDCD